MAEVVATDEFREWYEGLDDTDGEAVTFSVELLAECGVALGHPHSSAIKGTKSALRELRAQSAGKPLRVLYAFDPLRQAVLLLGGEKSAGNRFYEVAVPRAEKIWQQYLAEQAAGLHEVEDAAPKKKQ